MHNPGRDHYPIYINLWKCNCHKIMVRHECTRSYMYTYSICPTLTTASASIQLSPVYVTPHHHLAVMRSSQVAECGSFDLSRITWAAYTLGSSCVASKSVIGSGGQHANTPVQLVWLSRKETLSCKWLRPVSLKPSGFSVTGSGGQHANTSVQLVWLSRKETQKITSNKPQTIWLQCHRQRGQHANTPLQLVWLSRKETQIITSSKPQTIWLQCHRQRGATCKHPSPIGLAI